MKEFVCFSTTDVFVPVSQLSTRDLFYFLENLKFKQDIFFLSWISRRVRSVEQRALWYPYSRLFFGIVFKRDISWIFGVFTKSIVVSILDFWHISFGKMLELLTCKEIMTFESWASCGEFNMAKSLLTFRILSLLVREKKKIQVQVLDWW